MPNHFHLLFWQGSHKNALASMMRRALSGYGQYFNRRHGRSGPLCRDSFRSRPVLTASHLRREAVYINLNHDDDPGYAFCSDAHLRAISAPDWFATERILDAMGGLDAYSLELTRTVNRRREQRRIEDALDGLDEQSLSLLSQRHQS
ncbi:MAG: hypothetical protein WAP35_01820 [Solirubrobacterales bacterium]